MNAGKNVSKTAGRPGTVLPRALIDRAVAMAYGDLDSDALRSRPFFGKSFPKASSAHIEQLFRIYLNVYKNPRNTKPAPRIDDSVHPSIRSIALKDFASGKLRTQANFAATYCSRKTLYNEYVRAFYLFRVEAMKRPAASKQVRFISGPDLAPPVKRTKKDTERAMAAPTGSNQGFSEDLRRRLRQASRDFNE